jgi:hypothetical protein
MELEMAFEEIKPLRRGGRRTKEGARVACYKEGDRHTFTLRVGPRLAETLGWRKGSKVSAQIGVGADCGYLRVAGAADGRYTLSHVGGRQKSLSLRSLILADDQSHPTEDIQHRIEDGALYIRLPDWCNGAA